MTYLSGLLADYSLGRIGQGKGLGPWGNIDVSDVSAAAEAFTKIISNLIGFFTIIAGLWFIIQLIIGAYEFLSAGGDEKQLERAKKRFTNAVLGLVIVVAAFALVSLFGALLGLDILNPQEIITKLGP